MAKHCKEKTRKLNRNIIRKMIWFMMLMVLVILALTSCIKIVKWYLNNKENENILEDISDAIKIDETQETANKYKINFDMLKEKNSDTIAFLQVNGTNIEIPVVQTNNNDFYLTHNFYKEYNSSGWIFVDYKNKLDGTDKNIVIYGHNTKGNTMFSSLKNVIKEEWYNNENNYQIVFITESEYSIYEVFSVYQIEKENYYIQTNFQKNDEFATFLETIKNRSVKDFKVEVSSEDSIITLSTCANNNKYRIVLHAKKIKI